MADISRELAAIRNAVYGEEVRGSIIAALEKINQDSGSGGETVDIEADDLGLTQNPVTEYVYPTYKGTASSHGIRISGGGESSSDYIFYYIFYYNYDGSELLYVDVVDKGEDGDYDGTPERASSGGNAYTFVGWSTSKNATTAEANCTKNITEDKQVYAAYNVTVSSVELKYYNYDGSQLLNTETVAYGGDGTYSGTPTRSSTAQYDYTFVGWSTSTNATSATANAIKNLTADKSVYAAYSRATKTYTLTYYNYNGGSSLYTEILPYGKNGTYTGTPTRASTAQYTYTFIGWSTTKNATTVDANATKNLTSDRSVYAVYSQQARTYSLKYYNYDGTSLLNTDTVAYGGNGTYSGTPARASDSQYAYTFVGWSTTTNATSSTTNATQNITADKNVYAAYSVRPIGVPDNAILIEEYDGIRSSDIKDASFYVENYEELDVATRDEFNSLYYLLVNIIDMGDDFSFRVANSRGTNTDVPLSIGINSFEDYNGIATQVSDSLVGCSFRRDNDTDARLAYELYAVPRS